MDKNKYIFLLGGHDLEMLEIRKILESHDLKEGSDFFDKDLQWGAKLSSYIGCFDNEKTFVGIELTQDIAPPKNYIEIDHHNENSIKPSSIEQIAELIGVELNRYQKLVAANDKGYIPEMMKAGASREEADEIRSNDRLAQGISSDENEIAREALKTLKTENGVIVVQTQSVHFSPIVDMLFPFEHLIVYNATEFTYYGCKSEKLGLHFKQLINNKIAYYGGGINGFFGGYLNSCPLDELLNTLNKL